MIRLPRIADAMKMLRMTDTRTSQKPAAPSRDSAWQAQLDELIERQFDRMQHIRRYLHAHPETSGDEYGTTRYLHEQLGGAGYDIRQGPGGRGLIVDGRLRDAPADHPCIGLRADIDALFIDDAKQSAYRSRVPGVMHACGHDAHSAIVLGVLLALRQADADGALPWPVRFRGLFQPAEETATGAREMIEAGAIDGVAALLALHVDPTRRTGRIGIRTGAFTADCQEIIIDVSGAGGHASRPHESRDPIAAAAQFICALYQFVHRSIDSQEPVVVAIGEIKGGANYNVIPDHVSLRGTLRCFSRPVKETAMKRISKLAMGIAQASDTRIDIRYRSGPPAVVNDAAMTSLIRIAATGLLGRDNVDDIPRPSMGGEDFAYYLSRVPGAMFRLGAAADPSSGMTLHAPGFDIDESAMTIGAKILARTAVAWSDPDLIRQPSYEI